MNRLIYIMAVFFLSAGIVSAQKRGFEPEKIYRPVYGYVVDTCTNQPVSDVLVYGFDSMEDALAGRKALETCRSPLKARLKGDVVEVRTDASGRYMLPARSCGVVLFWFRDGRKAVMEEIRGRSSVSLGRKEKEWSVADLDLDKYVPVREDPRKGRRLAPAGVDLNMDFKCYLPYLGEEAASSRIWVERRITDMETGKVLNTHVPVVRDGKEYHRRNRRLADKGMICDTLLEDASREGFLSEKTSEIRVADVFSTDPWKDRCFRLGYFVMQDKGGEIRHIDTLYMFTNRVSNPLKYVEYRYEPYQLPLPQTESPVQRRSVKRRVVLEGEYEGSLPEVLQDTSYLMEELHLKAEVTSCGTYQENIVRADSLVTVAMKEFRDIFADKMHDGVRVTMTSSAPSQRMADKVTYRIVFRTDRRFSQKEYLDAFANADELEPVCVRALEESEILEGKPWDYAANMLASVLILERRPDTDLLAPFVDAGLEGCDIAGANRKEIVANHVMMLMMAGKDSMAAALAAILPDDYADLRVLAGCKAGTGPSTYAEVEALAMSSPRNMVVADMFTGILGVRTADALRLLPENDAMTWFLRARYLCLMHDNDLAGMRTARLDGHHMTIYDAVRHCLEKCFDIGPDFKTMASHDAAIEEAALKEVLGVLVL